MIERSPSLMCRLLSVGKSVIHLQVESGTLSCHSLFCSRTGCGEARAEVHKQDPGAGFCGIQMLQDVVEGHVDCVCRPVGSVGELLGA